MSRPAVQSHEGYSQLNLLPGLTTSLPVSFDDDHGEVFTRRWIVEFILDLVGFSDDRDLATLRIVEPACGAGAFLVPIVERLSKSLRRHGLELADALESLRAYDLLPRNINASRLVLRRLLVDDGWPSEDVEAVLDKWLRIGDYLLLPLEGRSADFVVGNPPYIRIEEVPEQRMQAYRRACASMVGRADIYVGFYEVALRSLRQDGKLGFICADRWMRNQYGRVLRELISKQYSVDAVVTMHDVDAFEEQVSAYPAVTVLSRRKQGPVEVVDTKAGFGVAEGTLVLTHNSQSHPAHLATATFTAARLPHWFSGDQSWPNGSPERLALIEYLTDNFPPLQDSATGTRVGIGVATGADGAFLTKDLGSAEQDRLLPLSMVKDIKGGHLEWSGTYLANPWGHDGRLVPLGDYPKLAEHFERYRKELSGRYVAGKAPDKWYKTIDKVDPTLTARSKLLIPDMRLTIHPVLDEGTTYPHHNLYYVVSDSWDMRVLGGLLLSRVAQAFIEAYAVKMRGGTLRFQAQYLRRIRVPRQSEMAAEDAVALADAFERRDVEAATRVTLRIFKLEALEI